MASDNSKYLKAGLGYTIGNYLLKGISFFSLPLFVRLMTRADYGNFNTYAAYESIFCIIIGLALHTSLKNAKYKYKNPGEFESFISSCIQIGIVSTAFFLIVANIAYPLYADIVDMPRRIFNLLIVESYATSLITTYNMYISLEYKYKSFLIVSFLNVVLNILLSLFLMFTFFQNDRYLARVLGTAIPVIVIAIYISVFFIRLGKLQFNVEHWKYALAFSVPLVFHGVSQVILNQFDRIMIKTMTGSDNAGIYSFAYNISSLVLITVTSLLQVWQPWFYEKMGEKNYVEIRRRGNQLAFGMLLFTSCVICGAREVILILGTQEYQSGIYFLIPILIGGYFSFLYHLPAQVEYYYEKTSYIAIGTCIAAILNIFMNYIGVKTYGSIAAAYTTLIIYGLYFTIHYYIAVKIQGGALFDGKKIGLYCTLILAVGASAILLNKYWFIRWMMLLVIGIYLVFWLNNEFDFISLLKSRFAKRKTR